MLTVLRFVFAIVRLSSGMLSRCRIWFSISDRNGDITTRSQNRGNTRVLEQSICSDQKVFENFKDLP